MSKGQSTTSSTTRIKTSSKFSKAPQHHGQSTTSSTTRIKTAEEQWHGATALQSEYHVQHNKD